jgi:peptidoglycan biosynthesis protein MviN/MurJ (putative lipid II flippase)
LIRYLDYTGIATAFVVSKYLKGITLLFLLKRIIPFNNKETLNYIIKLFLAAICFTITLWLMLDFFHKQISADDLITKILAACFILFGSSSVYIVVIRVLKINP